MYLGKGYRKEISREDWWRVRKGTEGIRWRVRRGEQWER